jgi:hypothetical protein
MTIIEHRGFFWDTVSIARCSLYTPSCHNAYRNLQFPAWFSHRCLLLVSNVYFGSCKITILTAAGRELNPPNRTVRTCVQACVGTGISKLPFARLCGPSSNF